MADEVRYDQRGRIALITSRAGGRSVRNIDQKCRGGYWTPVHKCPTVLS